MKTWLQWIITIISPVISVATFYMKVASERKSDEEARKQEREAEYASLRKAIKDGLAEVNSTVLEDRKEFQRQINELNEKHNKEIYEIRLEFEKQYQGIFEKVDERRRKDTAALHKRIDEFEGGFASEVMERIGKLEGTVTARIEGMQSTLDLIQRHFIENGR